MVNYHREQHNFQEGFEGANRSIKILKYLQSHYTNVLQHKKLQRQGKISPRVINVPQNNYS